MPAVTKRRKVSTTKNVAASSRGLDAFTKVSKVGSIAKTIIEKNNSVDVSFTGVEEYAIISRKRKLVDSEEELSSPETVISRTIRAIPSSSARLPPRSKIPQTPHKPIVITASPASLTTPTKGARNLLDRFRIDKTPTKSPSGFHNSSSDLVPSTQQNFEVEKKSGGLDLPNELVDLINLHAAFLTALSIHYAHNGTHSPADLRNLCPDVARAWGKRGVVLDDIRRILGVLNSRIGADSTNRTTSTLSLSDYSHGKICIEIAERGAKSGRIARPINEDFMNETFAHALVDSWNAKSEDMEMRSFIKSLPMEAITTCSSVSKISPLLAKGQRRLEDMKVGMAANQANKTKTKVTEATSNGRKLTLLERLRAKQLENANLPPPPSKEELSRKQALQRIEEVVSVLAILSTSSSIGQQRVSFTMATVIGKLKDSLKTPMSKEEAGNCVQLVATEIAPEWVKLVKMRKNEALVVNRDERPMEETVRKRVARALSIE
jgi:hypothetical protein